MKTVLITGSGGLVGSESVHFFSPLAERIIGIDNNFRGEWFGFEGSVLEKIFDTGKVLNYKHIHHDVRDYIFIDSLIKDTQPDIIIHCAGQPSHEKSAEIPFEDFQVNTVGTVNLLEAMRKYVPKASFIFTSTNKVYGDLPNSLEMVENEFRYDLICNGINETMAIDQCMHSPFGANKAAADLIVQEYGRYYGLNTVCFRCGCITGVNHQGVEQHGFLSYLCKSAKNNKLYTIYGHKGKQVRDNIHAKDLVSAFYNYSLAPKQAAVYNIGGGYKNSCSILEAIQIIENKIGHKVEIIFDEPRKGDHICYLTDYNLFASHYPSWEIQYSLDKIFQELLT